MTREEARKAAEVMLAYADGKEIEYLCKDGWRVTTDALFNWGNDANYYRIKPQSKYRPFKDAEECWQEMQKHQPFGWIQSVDGDKAKKCILFVDLYVVQISDRDDNLMLSYSSLFEDYTFIDGMPFGIKEEQLIK